MKHDHAFTPAATGSRCRICGNNDPDALIDEIAESLWEASRDLALGDPPFADASDYWQTTLRGYAREMIAIVHR